MNKKKIFIIGLIVISVLMVITLPFLAGRDRDRDWSKTGEDRVVVIYLNGTIQESLGLFLSGGISPHFVNSQLERAASDQSIKGVVLRIESPGGSIAASQDIAAMVREFEKPIVVSMGDMAASGGYYIAAPAQGIIAQPGTMTGSIGVISTLMNMEGLYEMIGIEVEVIKSGEHKDMLSRTMTDDERMIMQDISDEAYNQFILAVAEGRRMDPERVRILATGQIYLGSQALELGLVDRLGGIEDAIDYLAELNNLENPVRYEFPQPPMFAQLFSYGYKVLSTIERSSINPELVILEMLREGIKPDIRYQVR
ncbi:MAG: signal peptide peptidase SppA [Bacillota bacterium]|nr:signal peptide peptidase SppA [Bacillota bacterium]